MHRSVPLLALLPVLATSTAAQVNWLPGNAASRPTPRFSHAMAYHAGAARVVMFGGQSAQRTESDTWHWDGTRWLWMSGFGPGPRQNHAMAYCASRQTVVLFGGVTGPTSGLMSNDTWEWNGLGWTRWIGRMGTGTPSARAWHAMAYDSARDKVVLFGGFRGTSPYPERDTWEWDANGGWRQRFPATRPLPAEQHAMAYDASRQRVVMFTGDWLAGLSTTWEWDGNDWTQAFTANAPPIRHSHGLVYDASRQRVVLFGGVGVNGITLNDTWEWDGQAWTQRSPLRSPAPRSFHGMAYDEARARVVLFGGGEYRLVGPPVVNAETWEYGPVSPATFAPFGSGCSGSAGVPALVAAPNVLPWLGSTFAVDVTGLPAPETALVLLGLGRASPPVPLDTFGMPGCLGFVDLNAPLDTRLLTGSGGSARWQAWLPLTNAFAGMRFYQQAVVLDPAAGNAAGAVVSNAGEGQLGMR